MCSHPSICISEAEKWILTGTRHVTEVRFCLKAIAICIESPPPKKTTHNYLQVISQEPERKPAQRPQRDVMSAGYSSAFTETKITQQEQ